MWRPDLEDYLATARVVLGLPYEQLRRLPGLALAESALAAPFAGFAGQEAYPALEQKAAVLLERLVRNHPLPDGNTPCARTIDGAALACRLAWVLTPGCVGRYLPR